MKTKFYHFLILFSLPLLLFACQSLQALYKAGDYDKSFKAALRQLNKKPQDDEALFILEESLNQLIATQQEEFTRLRKTDDPETWEKALDVVAEMDELIGKTEPYLVKPFAEEQAGWWADALALEEQLYLHYLDRGKQRLERSIASDNAVEGQNAYYDFARAIHYQRADFPETEQLAAYQAEAIKAGTVYYSVEINGGFNIGLGVNVDRAFGNLEQNSSLFLSINEEFIANSGDCVIRINFGEFQTEISERQQRQEFTQNVITSYRTETDTSGNITEIPVYEDVSGWVETVTNIKTAVWSVGVDVDQRTRNCTVFGNNYSHQLTSEVEYYRTGGDERAVPDQYKNNARRDEHPDDDDMAEELLEILVSAIYRDYF